MDSPLGFRHQTGVDAVETRHLSSTQEVPHSTSVEKSWPQFSGITKACCWWITNLRQAVKERRREILTRGPLLLHDNAPAHVSRVAQAIVKDIGYEQLSRPLYSPDLAPSDFYLFRHLKQHLHGTRFFDDELWQPMQSYLDNMPRNSI